MRLLLKRGQTAEQYQAELQKWNEKIKKLGHRELEYNSFVGNRVETSRYFIRGTAPHQINWGKAVLYRNARLFMHHAGLEWHRKLKYRYISLYIMRLYVEDGLTYRQIQRKLKVRARANITRRRHVKQNLTRKRIFKPTVKYTTFFISECLVHDLKLVAEWIKTQPPLLGDDDGSFIF
jgi:hypothetical protein